MLTATRLKRVVLFHLVTTSAALLLSHVCRRTWQAATAAKDDLLKLNIFSGYCSCLDFALHGLCAHFLAAERLHLQRLRSKFTWSSAALAPTDATAAVTVQRQVQAPQLLSDDLEPTKCLSRPVQEHLQTLRRAVEASRTRTPGQAEATAEQKAAARACASIQQAMKVVPSELAAADILPDLQRLAQKASSLVPQFASLRSALHNGPRQDPDRLLYPLHGGVNAHKQDQRRRRRRQKQQQRRQQQQQEQQHSKEQPEQRRVLKHGQQLVLTQDAAGKWGCQVFSRIPAVGRPPKRGRGVFCMVGSKRLRPLRQ